MDDTDTITNGGVIGSYNYVTRMRTVFNQKHCRRQYELRRLCLQLRRVRRAEELAAADVLMTISADNSSTNHDLVPVYPACYDVPNIISVTATQSVDRIGHSLNIPSFGYGRANIDIAAWHRYHDAYLPVCAGRAVLHFSRATASASYAH